MKTQAQSIVLTNGVNLNKDPRAIRQDQLALSKNAWPVTAGILGKRNGVTGMRVAIIATTNHFIPQTLELLSPITGYSMVGHFHKWDATSPTHSLVASSFDRESASFPNSKVQDLGAFQTDYEPIQFVNYRGWCYAIVPGVEGFYILGPKYLKGKPTPEFVWTKASFLFDPAVTGIQNSQLTPVTPSNAAVYKQRMVWANFGPGMENWIIMADKATSTVLVQPTTYPLAAIVGTDVLSLNGRYIPVGALEGQSIVAMSEVTLASMGSQIDSFLMLLSDRTCVFVSGEILQTNDSGATDPNGLFGTYKENRVNYECGCVGQNTLIHTPYGYFWASADDVWFMNDNTPDRIGTNIRPALLVCPATYRKHWSIAYANGVIMLQLVTGSSVTEAGTGSGNITTYLHQYWILDLRDGLPQTAEQAKWFGPIEIASEDGNSLVFGPLQTISDSDGRQRIVTMATYTTNNYTMLVDMLPLTGSGYDIIQDGFSGADVWQANTAYAVGDVVRPVFSKASVSIAGVMGNIYMAVAIAGNGQTGGTEPTWTVNGLPFVDNNVTWESIGGADTVPLSGIMKQNKNCDFTADIRTRDSMLDESVHEKLLRRVDVNVSPSNKVQLTATAILNQQSAVSLGASIFGGASPELGIAELPFTVAGVKSVARAFRPAEGSLIKGRDVQISLTDSTGYVIDSTNDYFVVTMFNESGGNLRNVQFILQVSVPHAVYNTIDDILAALTAKLNSYISTMLGFGTFPGSAWSYNTAFSGGAPWMTGITLSYTSWTSALNYPGFIFSNNDYTTILGTGIVGDDTGTLYLSRSKRLATLLGFDTSETALSPLTTSVLWNGIGAVSDLTFFLSIPSSSPFVFNGIQVVQQKNSQRFDIMSETLLIQPKTANPMVTLDRS